VNSLVVNPAYSDYSKAEPAQFPFQLALTTHGQATILTRDPVTAPFYKRLRELALTQNACIRKEDWAFEAYTKLTGMTHPSVRRKPTA
jgi:hypothetical protein